MKINSVYQQLFTTDKRYTIITGGRGSGKSTNVIALTNAISYEKAQKILFCRYTMKNAEETIIPECKKIYSDLIGVGAHFSFLKDRIVNNCSGNQLYFSGIKTSSGNQTANLKGHNATTFVGDEMEEWINEEEFDTLDKSVRTKGVKNRIILILNPCDTSHWIYQRFIANTNEIKYFDGLPVEISTHPDVCHIHTTYLDNLINLDEVYIKSLLDDKVNRPDFYARKIIGQWSSFVDSSLFKRNLFKSFNADEQCFYEDILAYVDVADQGTDYLSCYIGGLINKRIHIIDIIYLDKQSEITMPLVAAALNKHNVRYCRVESNGMGLLYMKQLQQMTKAKLLEVVSKSNKHTRILMDSNDINTHFYYSTKRSDQYEKALIHLSSYTNDEKINKANKINDDSADCASGLMTFFRGMYKNIF